MRKEYLFNDIRDQEMDISTRLGTWYDDKEPNDAVLDVVDYRESVEIRLRSKRDPGTALRYLGEFCQYFTNRGYRETLEFQPQRRLFGVKFDCSGDDFDSLKIFMRIEDLHEWTLRFHGRDRRPVTELVAAINTIMNQAPSTSMAQRIQLALLVEKTLYS